ncbi:MAG: antitoxin family protein [Planctomycetales bacterium]
MTIHAVYERGVFRPTEKVDLPEGQEVEAQVKHLPPPAQMTEVLATH